MPTKKKYTFHGNGIITKNVALFPDNASDTAYATKDSIITTDEYEIQQAIDPSNSGNLSSGDIRGRFRINESLAEIRYGNDGIPDRYVRVSSGEINIKHGNTSLLMDGSGITANGDLTVNGILNAENISPTLLSSGKIVTFDNGTISLTAGTEYTLIEGTLYLNRKSMVIGIGNICTRQIAYLYVVLESNGTELTKRMRLTRSVYQDTVSTSCIGMVSSSSNVNIKMRIGCDKGAGAIIAPVDTEASLLIFSLPMA
ncbi:MAG: hypothetical protein ACXQS8_06765 [Candidatus Helarchaeales archaeon]